MPKRGETGEFALPSLRESQIQRAIVELLIAERVFAIRMNTGKFRTAHGSYVSAHSGGPGLADLLTFPHDRNGRSITCWMEVKRPGGKQSPEQRNFQERVEEEGHVYLLVHSSEEVLQWLQTLK